MTLMSGDRRIDINDRVRRCAKEFEGRAILALKLIRIVNNINFDLRNLSNEDGLKYLKDSLGLAKSLKEQALHVRKSINDLVFNLDHYIAKHAQDVRKVQARIDAEREREP